MQKNQTAIGGGRGGKTTRLSVSAMRDFLSCRRKFWFRYIEGLAPSIREAPLSFGSAGHAGLAALFAGKRAPIGPKTEVEKAIFSEYTPDEIELSGVAPKVALESVNAFGIYVDWPAWKVTDTEMYFEIKIDRGRYLHGYFDGFTTQNGELCLLENKFVSSIDESYLNHLLWDDQAGYYILAARMLGKSVAGILYNLIQKPSIRQFKATPEDQRKYTKEGKLYANQRDKDENNEDYIARVRNWYQENKDTFCFRQLVMRNNQQLEALEKRFKLIVSDLRSCQKENAYYPNGDACAFRGCPYSSLCLEDVPEIRQVNFINRKEVEEKKELKQKADETL